LAALSFAMMLVLCTLLLLPLAASGSLPSLARECAVVTRSAALSDPCSKQMRVTAPPVFDLSFRTNFGDILANCVRSRAPAWVDRVYNLALNGYYDANYFFRVVDSPTLHIVQFGTNGDPSLSNVYNVFSPSLGSCAVIHPQPPFMPIGTPSLSNTAGTLSMSTSFSSVFNSTWNSTAELFLNLGDNSRLDPLLFVPICILSPAGLSVAETFPSYGELSDLGGPGPSLELLYAEGNSYISGNGEYDEMAITSSLTVSCGTLTGGEGVCGPCRTRKGEGVPFVDFENSSGEWRCPDHTHNSCSSDGNLI
jgi:cyclophilin family peptidyl-prolyl cis-trans isomerase